jgi:hypothetical protein
VLVVERLREVPEFLAEAVRENDFFFAVRDRASAIGERMFTEAPCDGGAAFDRGPTHRA